MCCIRQKRKNIFLHIIMRLNSIWAVKFFLICFSNSMIFYMKLVTLLTSLKCTLLFMFVNYVDWVRAAELLISCLRSRCTWTSKVAQSGWTASLTASSSSVLQTSLWVRKINTHILGWLQSWIKKKLSLLFFMIFCFLCCAVYRHTTGNTGKRTAEQIHPGSQRRGHLCHTSLPALCRQGFRHP